MKAQDVITAILTGSLDSDRENIIAAIRERDKAKRNIERFTALITIKVGDRVVLQRLNPKYLNGLTGLVTGRNNTRFVVSLDNPALAQRFAFANTIIVPASSLEVVK